MSLLNSRKIGLLGVGNMNQAIMGGLLKSQLIQPGQVYVTNRSQGKLKKIVEQYGVHSFSNNEELIENCDVIIVGVKPQDLYDCLEPIASVFDESQIVISLAAGISLESLSKLLPEVKQLIRVMPNTPAKIGAGVVGYCLHGQSAHLAPMIEQMLSPLGLVVQLEEGEEFEALTVSSSSGVGFIFEMMIYWQEWLEEHGIEPEVARKMTVKTFLGAAQLADNTPDVSLVELQSKVVSKKGVTAAGLDSMRELEVERGLRYSFEKAVLRDREMGKLLSPDKKN